MMHMNDIYVPLSFENMEQMYNFNMLTVGCKYIRPPLFFISNNRGTLKFRINLKILMCAKKMAGHEFVLFETQPSATMLSNYQNGKILILSQ